MTNGKLLVYPALWSPLSAEGGNKLDKKQLRQSHTTASGRCPAIIIVQGEATKMSPEFQAVFVEVIL